MANPANRTSENILKEGFLRHKHTSVALARWRLRYVVFKTMSSGRFQFMVYKEHPPSPSNEIKEIPIEEFGGIESNLKLDNEKNAFAIISTSFTDCFSVETPEEMQEWVRVLQRYLGKELVLNITIPHKQHMLKSGKAQLRIRNTGFTISTCDNPPRCQGTWQIIHIRKFGGTDAFRFETGSKCPTGEYRYTISTDDNSRVKALFNDLSQHKPIFTDDVVGRRMTLESRIHRENRTTSPTPHPGFNHPKGNRLSLQTREAPTHPHENRLQHINRDHFRYNSADPIMQPPSGRRHSANEDRIYNPFTRPIPKELLRNGSSRSIEDLRDREYQNVHRTSAHGRHSPLKRNQLASSQVATAVGEQIPEGYYNVSPPRVLGRYRNSSSSPPSAGSPEEESFLPLNGFVVKGEGGRSGKSPPIEEEDEGVNGEEYVHFTPVTVSLQGEHLVVQRGSTLNGHAGPTSAPHHGLPRLQTPPPQQQDGPQALYENLEFMKGTGSGGSNPTSPLHSVSRESKEPRRASSASFFPTADSTPASEHGPLSDTDWSPHNYTNVEFALESAQRRPMPRAVSPRKTFPRHNESSLVHQVHTKKPSTPARRGYSEHSRKISTPNCNSDSHSPHLMATLSPTRLTALSYQSRLRSSHSNFELHAQSENADGFKSGRSQPAALPEYYNLFVPDLPARSSRQTESIDSGVVVGTRSQPQSPGAESSKSGTESDQASVTSPAAISPPPPTPADVDVAVPVTANGYAKFSRGNKLHAVMSTRLAGYASLPEMRDMAKIPVEHQIDNPSRAGVTGRGNPSNYDHLEIRSPCLSPEPEARATSPRPGCYDTLAPTTDENQPVQILDFSVRVSRNGGKSSSSSPEPALLPPAIVQKVVQYQRKTDVLGHGHNYEYIEVEPTVNGSASLSDGESQPLREQSGSSSRFTRSGSESPTGNEHPLDWLSPRHTSNGDASVFNFEEEKSKRDCVSPPAAIITHRFSRKTTNSGSRRKPLPLQDSPIEEIDGDSKGAGGTAVGGVDDPTESKALPQIPPKKSKLRSSSEKQSTSGRDVAGPKEESPKLPLKKSKQRSGSGRQASPSRDMVEVPQVPRKKSRHPGLLIGSTSVDRAVERTESEPLSSLSLRKPLPLPKPKKIRATSQPSSDSSELLSSGEQEDAETAKRQSTVSNESASSVESDKKSLTLSGGRGLHAASPLRRDTHENVTLKPPSRKIKSITVETVLESDDVAEDAIAGPECPPRLPKRTSSKHPMISPSEEQLSPPTAGEEEVDHNPPACPRPPSDYGSSPSHVPPKSEEPRPPIPPYPNNFTVQLPHANIEFHKPPVPPKPRLLSYASDPGEEERAKYISVDFDNSYLAEARARQAMSASLKSQTLGSSSNRLERVDYLAIDFRMSAQLAILKEEREEERREFIAASKKN